MAEFADEVVFTYEEHELSPDIALGRDFLKLHINDLVYEEGVLGFGIYLTAMLPTATAMRYQDLEEGFVFVFSDTGQKTSLALKSQNDFAEIDSEDQNVTNLIANVPFPLPDPSATADGAFRGCWINAGINLKIAFPKQAPSLFVHAIFENYHSNVVAIDVANSITVTF